MFWSFIATVFCGLGAAGIALGICKATRSKAPKWIIPVFAGAGMLGFLIFNEYTWYDLKQSRLPEGAVVVDTQAAAIFWRPWTFVFPYVTSFSTVDTKNIDRDTGNPDMVGFILYRFEQSLTETVSHRTHILNCATRKLVPLNIDGTPMVDNIKLLDNNHILLRTVCND